jgi:N-acetylneuraminic acid mutarotase
MGVVKGKDGKLYAIGGANARGPLNTVEALDPAASSPQWSLLPAHLHTARYALAATVGADGKIYAVGGVSNDFTILDTVEVYDPAASSPQWTTLKTRLTLPRKGLAAVTAPDGKIYAIGGAGPSGLLNSVEAYDPTAVMPQWTQVSASLNTGRQDFAAVVGLDNRIYAIGGFGTRGKPLDSVEVCDAAVGHWSTLPITLPEARYGHAAVVGPAGRIYILGGRVGVPLPTASQPAYTASNSTDASPGGPDSVPPVRLHVRRRADLEFSLDSAASLDPGSNDLQGSRLITRLGTPRERFGALVDPSGRIWLIGGVDPHVKTLRTTEIYVPDDSAKSSPH